MIDSVPDLCRAIKEQPGFGFLKVNHGFWDHMALARQAGLSPFSHEDAGSADLLIGYEGTFTSGFPERFRSALAAYHPEHSPLQVHVSLIAASGATSTPRGPSFDALREFTSLEIRDQESVLLKSAAENGRIGEIFDVLANRSLIVVGPSYLGVINQFFPNSIVRHLQIAEWQGFKMLSVHRSRLRRALADEPDSVVLMQAGPIGVLDALELHEEFPSASWVDFGSALSIVNLDSIATRPWFLRRADELIRSSLRAARVPEPNKANWSHIAALTQQILSTVEEVMAGRELSAKETMSVSTSLSHLPVRLPTYYALLAKAVLPTGQYGGVENLLVRAIEASSEGDVQPRILASRLFQQVGNMESATAAARVAVANAPFEPEGYRQLARLRAIDGDIDGALKVLEEGLAQFDIAPRRILGAQDTLRAGAIPL